MENKLLVLEKHIVEEIQGNTRVYEYAVNLFVQLPTRKSVQKAIKKGLLRVNKSKVETGRFLKAADVLELIEEQRPLDTSFEQDIEVVYEDEYLAVVIKPAGLVVSGNQFKTLVNALPNNVQLSKEKDALPYPKPVHRLDAQTSGLVLVAKTATSVVSLSKLFEEKQIEKEYCAVVVGKPDDSGVINLAIEKQEAESSFQVLKTIPSLKNEYLSLVKLSPKTGRTHQLRIHMVSIGFPIVGDKLYGEEGKTLEKKGLFLAAIQLKFKHPVLQQILTFSISPPDKFETYLKREAKMYAKYQGNE
jgi:23S rRNA pseudouridine1911/1915/1917 synthase